MDELTNAYGEHQGRLRSWLAAKTGEEDAEDILQELFARAFANLDALEPVRDIAAWLWRSAANALRDHWRAVSRRKRRLSGDAVDLDGIVADAGFDQADRIHRELILSALRSSIASLPPEQRLVIENQALGDHTFRSLSACTGIPVDTLASRKRYALEKIRSDLAAFNEED